MFLERRVRGASLAAHGVYHDEQYFRAVTGLTDVKWIACKRTETTVRICMSLSLVADGLTNAFMSSRTTFSRLQCMALSIASS